MIVTAKKAVDLSPIVTRIDKQEKFFNEFVPMPTELVDTRSPSLTPNKEFIEKYGFDNWYDWSVANWGVKWDAGDFQFQNVSDTKFIVYFTTAWGPPANFIEKLAKLFPKLTITNEWSEEGGEHGMIYAHGNTYKEK
jgi:hypothetical protein